MLELTHLGQLHLRLLELDQRLHNRQVLLRTRCKSKVNVKCQRGERQWQENGWWANAHRPAVVASDNMATLDGACWFTAGLGLRLVAVGGTANPSAEEGRR